MNREVCAMAGVVCLLGAALAEIPRWLAAGLAIIAGICFLLVRQLWLSNPR